MTFTSDVLTIERSGPVATLWLDRPEARNAMGRALFEDMPRAMAHIDDDDDVRALVVAARGDHFTVGLDLKDVGGSLAGGGNGRTPSKATAASRTYRLVAPWQNAMTVLEQSPKPVIAAVHGWVIGGGIDLITAADIRLASADARFSVRETKVAIVADLGTLQRLPRVIAPGHAAELAFTGKDIDAARAREIGLVNDVADDVEAVHRVAHEMAAEIAANSPLVVQGVKRVMRASRDLTVEQGLDYVAVWNSAFLESNDLMEAMTAFIEKRQPVFRGD